MTSMIFYLLSFFLFFLSELIHSLKPKTIKNNKTYYYVYIYCQIINMHEYTNYNIPRNNQTKQKPSHKNVNTILTKHLNAIGFNNRTKNRYIMKILPLGNNIQAIEKAEKQLIQEIKEIDYALHEQNQHLKYQQGFLFGEGLNKDLIRQFQKVLKNRIDCIQNGFYLWKLREKNDHQQEYQLISSRLIQSPRRFNHRLLQKSIANLQKYQNDKQEQSSKQMNRRWDYSIKLKNRQEESNMNRFKTESLPIKRYDTQSRYMNNSDLGQSEFYVQEENKEIRKMSVVNRLPPIGYMEVGKVGGKYESKKTLLNANYYKRAESKQMSEIRQGPSRQELIRMIQKEDHIVSIWLPPASYPQFLGIVSIQIKEKQAVSYCQIKKYFFYKHGVSRRLFNTIMNYVSGKYSKVEYLEMITTRAQYSTIFNNYGWKIFSWVSQQKIKIIYKNNEEKQI